MRFLEGHEAAKLVATVVREETGGPPACYLGHLPVYVAPASERDVLRTQVAGEGISAPVMTANGRTPPAAGRTLIPPAPPKGPPVVSLPPRGCRVANRMAFSRDDVPCHPVRYLGAAGQPAKLSTRW